MIEMGQPLINPRSPVPVYAQLAAIVREQIMAGKLAPDEPLPSQKELTAAYGVARGTAAKAVVSLQDEGLVFTVKGKGAYVAAAADRERHRLARARRSAAHKPVKSRQ